MADSSSPPPSPEKHVVDKKLVEPYRYINSVPGKDVRGKLIDCFQLWLNVPSPTPADDNGDGQGGQSPSILNEIKTIVADLHNASLLIDDIEDNSKLRRGVPVAHSIFGVAPVINTANYVYFLALERCHGLKNEDAMKVCIPLFESIHFVDVRTPILNCAQKFARCLYKKCSIYIEVRATTSTGATPRPARPNPNIYPWSPTKRAGSSDSRWGYSNPSPPPERTSTSPPW